MHIHKNKTNEQKMKIAKKLIFLFSPTKCFIIDSIIENLPIINQNIQNTNLSRDEFKKCSKEILVGMYNINTMSFLKRTITRRFLHKEFLGVNKNIILEIMAISFSYECNIKHSNSDTSIDNLVNLFYPEI